MVTESLYQQSTTFKDPVQNPIIGIGFDRQSLPSRAGKSNEGNVRLTAFAPRSGFMGVEVDPIRLFGFQPRRVLPTFITILLLLTPDNSA